MLMRVIDQMKRNTLIRDMLNSDGYRAHMKNEERKSKLKAYYGKDGKV